MNIIDVIKYEGDNSTFVWKHPAEDFNTMSQLIVHESQEALLFLNGQACDLFGPGRHTLSTQNIPLLNKIINAPSGGVSPFHCEVYFINKVEQMAISWGVGAINYADPTLNNYVFKIGANGEMSIRVADSRKLIVKLVGTETLFNQDTLRNYFKAPITTHIKTLLPSLLKQENPSIFDVENDLAGLSNKLKGDVANEMADYGISIEKFWINAILKPEDDPYYRGINKQRAEKVNIENQGQLDIRKAEYKRQLGIIDYSTDIEKKKMDVDIEKYRQGALGYSYQQEQSFDVLKKMASNEGVGSGLMNAGMGIGAGIGVGNAIGNSISSLANNTMVDLNSVPNNNSNDLSSFKNKLDKLQMMKEAGLLSDEEFNAQKQELLKEAVK